MQQGRKVKNLNSTVGRYIASWFTKEVDVISNAKVRNSEAILMGNIIIWSMNNHIISYYRLD